MNRKRRTHKVLDHPLLGYFLLFVFGNLMTLIGNPIDAWIARALPGYASEISEFGGVTQYASGVGTGIAAIITVFLFWLWFRPDFDGMLKKENLIKGLVLLLPFLLFHYFGSIVSIITFGTGSVLIAFLRSFAPGFSEEVIYRGLGVANYMRTIRSEKDIVKIFAFSSVVFGLAHLGNILAGADELAAHIQAVYATGVGMAFCAVYLRTGNLWPTMIGHMTVDFVEFIRADLSASGGIMTGMGIGDWITIVAGIFAAFYGCHLISDQYKPEIMELWHRKWNREKADFKTAAEEHQQTQ